MTETLGLKLICPELKVEITNFSFELSLQKYQVPLNRKHLLKAENFLACCTREMNILES